ncbi:conserved phage C-terminal domain-containing protein [Clostridium botulinum]|uniref:conserved phage C-terminal domain-containing protein n=1 Tax=Clostridium botulinum TaxID=1491 RepID=UPI0004D7B622|nr:conserved phage C-terminal domain-containing protein [Clostridium botulinum]KEH96136.1 conserved phage family protein [Clostridium botulinum D str. 16868]
MEKIKYSVEGFSQERLLKHGLDTVDALILRYFIDFKDSGEMVLEIINGKPFYWLKYEKLLEEIPIAKIKNKDVLRRRLKRMEDAKILLHYQKRKKGNYSFYGIGPNYFELISNKPTKKSEGCDLKVGRVSTKKSEGSDLKVGTKDSSIKDSSIKKIYINIVEYLNKKANTNYRATTKKTKDLINARLNEGFEEKDFYTVIDKKVKEWLGTEWERFLRPETLFGTKFEGYLNQKAGVQSNGGNEVTSIEQNNAKEEDKWKGFKPQKPNITEEIDTTDLL